MKLPLTNVDVPSRYINRNSASRTDNIDVEERIALGAGFTDMLDRLRVQCASRCIAMHHYKVDRRLISRTFLFFKKTAQHSTVTVDRFFFPY